MGKQTAVAMTDADEKDFLSFIRLSSDIQLIESSAPTKEAMWADHFAPRSRGHWQYYIWNKAFDWAIEYGQVSADAHVVERRGWIYVANSSSAPLIEYDRHNFSDRSGLSYGRVYWAKYFAAGSESVHYDVNAFSVWYDQVVRWIRKNGKQLEKGSYNPYYLPDAFEQFGSKSK